MAGKGEASAPKLRPGSLVLAYDRGHFAEHLGDDLARVRDPAHFGASLDVIFDSEGLDVTLRWEESMTPKEIREKLEWLSKTDPKLWPYGAEEHGFRLAPPLSEAELEGICRAYAIELPGDYRDFLLQVGNGGAGPGYGLQRFGYVPAQSLLPHATAPGGIIEVQRDEQARVISRSDVFDVQGRKVDWFDISFYNTMRDLAGDGEHGPVVPSRPFPLAAPLDDDEDPFWQAPHWADGAWKLAGYGCGMDAHLVLNGPFRGQVWLIDPNEGSYQPFAERASLHSERCPVTREKSDDLLFTFAEWYEHWLD